MKQFNLSEWLEDKSLKVVTRNGKNVRIICTDRKTSNSTNVIGLAKNPYDVEQLLVCNTDGRDVYKEIKNDLFFADEEEELTEFEKVVQNILNEPHYQDIQAVKQWSKTLLDLARKEILKDNVIVTLSEWETLTKKLKEEYKRGYSIGKLDAGEAKVKELVQEFEKGRESALKDLPKWKKATEHKEFEVHVCVMDEDMYPYLDTEVNKGEYYIELSDLKTLQKEE